MEHAQQRMAGIIESGSVPFEHEASLRLNVVTGKGELLESRGIVTIAAESSSVIPCDDCHGAVEATYGSDNLGARLLS